ncbi:enolase C-terminal domain-like protein [Algoriphagus halophytocola]|uniref:Mandelate racemase n=1 Tax=Algoriphagus halophytocola TaxID=2991499 RepID=A0ABY6ML55_9BACT|nr:enolase C-terminal domain-like protein [Algoriphagus sp. TR-M5]UZD24393.1 mandelate racemase [Algoriphagus sp. TR-M5]
MKKPIVIKRCQANDMRFELQDGAGSDAIHVNPVYAYAVCKLETDSNHEGVGLAFTLGAGNNMVCQAIEYLSKHIDGKEIYELMADFGTTYKQMADDPSLRWLGPHKGVVQLALAAVVNACYDLWAKAEGVPLWKLLIDLPAEQLVNTLDFSYYEDVLTKQQAVDLINEQKTGRKERESILSDGYPGYDTSVGWFNYSDEKIIKNVELALENGFTAMKLKVGAKNPSHDIRRAELVRKIAGDQATIMFDANQQWNLPQAIDICKELKNLNPFWVEEPTHPDDVFAHMQLAKAVDVPIALGEHVPNKVIFKNFIQSGCMSFNQVDAVRVGGVSEFILISLLSRKFKIPVVPHVGDMGQIHQHLVLFNHISLGHPALLLEYIPHLKEHFQSPALVKDGKYLTPMEPGMSADLLKHEYSF